MKDAVQLLGRKRPAKAPPGINNRSARRRMSGDGKKGDLGRKKHA